MVGYEFAQKGYTDAPFLGEFFECQPGLKPMIRRFNSHPRIDRLGMQLEA